MTEPIGAGPLGRDPAGSGGGKALEAIVPDPAGSARGSNRPPRRSRGVLWACLLCVFLGFYWVQGVSMQRGLGYDEAMHAGFPAQRMALALRAGQPAEAADALLDCDRYPFVYPVVLAAVQLVTGPSEWAMRRTGRALWALTCFGMFLLAGETVRRRAPRQGVAVAPWVALLLTASSPLGLAYSGTLFLEVPFTCAMVFALRAWLRRDGRVSREYAAGALVTLAFFTKFNYGLALFAVLGLDLAIEALRARDRGQLLPLFTRSLHLAVIPVVAGVVWFVLLRGPEHRAAFLDFIGENRDASMARGVADRWIDWATHFALSPLVLALIFVGVLADLCPAVAIARNPARVARLVVLVFLLSLSLHPFHQDRFLLPAGVGLWCMAGLGLARLSPVGFATRTALWGALAALVYVTAPLLNILAVRAGGKWPADESGQLYVREVLKTRRSLDSDRPLPVAGLMRPEADRLFELLSSEVGPDERVTWLGIPSEVSRGVLHAGLLERGGSLERYLTQAPTPVLLETEEADPGLEDQQLLAWAEDFDVVLFTRPVDIKDRPGRRYLQAYVDRLVADPGWDAKLLGIVLVQRGPVVAGVGTSALDVRVFALRRVD